MQLYRSISSYYITTNQQLTSEMFGIVADTATILIAPHVPRFCTVL